MGAEKAVVVRPGEGHRVGNVEFLARTADTPRFNVAVVTIQPHRTGPGAHAHPAEDDSSSSPYGVGIGPPSLGGIAANLNGAYLSRRFHSFEDEIVIAPASAPHSSSSK